MLCAKKFSTVPPSGVTPRFRFYRCLENIHIQGRTHIYLNDHPPRQPSPNRQAESKINSHRGNTLWWVEILGIGFVEQGKETHGVPIYGLQWIFSMDLFRVGYFVVGQYIIITYQGQGTIVFYSSYRVQYSLAVV